MKFVKYVVFPIVALTALVIIVGFFMPKRLEVKVSKQLNAPVERVFPLVSNLKYWDDWSPWKENDPTMKMTRNREEGGVGQIQEWKSEKEGNGKLELVEVRTNELVRYNLTFVDWGAVSEGRFTFEEVSPDQTKVTWQMIGAESGSPFGRLMNALFAASVKEDFEQGLNYLERAAE